MFKFIHVADIHLDSPLRGLERYENAPVDEIRGATRRSLENLVNLAIAQRVDFVLIAGDVYDGDWKDHQTGLFFVAQMSRLRGLNIPVVMIAGNHDAANKMTKTLRLPDNVELLSERNVQTAKSPILADLGVAIHGRSFAKEAETENLSREYPPKKSGFFNIGLLHTSLEGAEGHERYAPCTLDDLRQKEYDYWALGHVHQRRVVCREPLMVFCGNTQGRQIRETGSKGCYVVSVSDDGRIDIQFEPLDVLRWEICKVPVDGIACADDLISLFIDSLTQVRRPHGDIPLAVRVIVHGRTPCHQTWLSDPIRWMNELRGAALDVSDSQVWVEKVKLETAPLVEWTSDMFADGPLGELFSFFRELRHDEGQLRELAGELADFQLKMPDELARGPGGLGLDDPERLRQWLAEIEPLVLNRLGVAIASDSVL